MKLGLVLIYSILSIGFLAVLWETRGAVWEEVLLITLLAFWSLVNLVSEIRAK